MRNAMITGALVASFVLTSSVAAQETTYRWLYIANLSTCNILDTNETLSDIKRQNPNHETTTATVGISGNSFVTVDYGAGAIDYGAADQNYYAYFVTQDDCNALKKLVDADRGKN